MKAYLILLVSIATFTAMSFNAVAHEETAKQVVAAQVTPFSGKFVVKKTGGRVDPQPIVTTCSAGQGESCALFASNCLAANGYYDGDSSGGVCCSGVDHPDNNPGSACN